VNRLPSKAAIAERAETEAKELFFLTLYLFIVFSALVFLKSAIMAADGVHWGYWGFAAIKAILVAKFILIGRALHIGEGLRTRPLIWQTLHKAIAFTIFVAILSVIEDAVIGMGVHGKTFSQSIADLGGGTVKQMIATEFIVFLVFVPLFAFGALSEVMEDKALVRAFFVKRMKFETVR
jgi:hypothetical protein